MMKIVTLFGLFCVSLMGMEAPQKQAHRSLLHAIRVQDISQVEKLLKAETNPNYFTDVQYKNDFSLKVAAGTMNIRLVQLLLSSNADPGIDEKLICDIYQMKTPTNENPFAFMKQREQILITLINHQRTNVNCIDSNGDTPLIKAVRNNDMDLVAALLKTNRVDKTIKDKRGKDAVFYAQKASVGIQELFGLENPPSAAKPAKPAPKRKPVERKEPKPKKKATSVVDTFKATIDALDRNYVETALHFLDEWEVAINKEDAQRGRILTVAINENALPVVQRLMQIPELEINYKNVYGLTPLMQASGSSPLEVVTALLRRKDLLINEITPQGKTALDYAMTRPGQRAEVSQLLRKHGAKTGSELASVLEQLPLVIGRSRQEPEQEIMAPVNQPAPMQAQPIPAAAQPTVPAALLPQMPYTGESTEEEEG